VGGWSLSVHLGNSDSAGGHWAERVLWREWAEEVNIRHVRNPWRPRFGLRLWKESQAKAVTPRKAAVK
jgi:hypothetical protein